VSRRPRTRRHGADRGQDDCSPSSSPVAAPSAAAHAHDEITKRLTAAMHAGAMQARAMHKALGLPIVVWRDGRPVWVDAETLEPVPEPPTVAHRT
jgi:hypothetical protein